MNAVKPGLLASRRGFGNIAFLLAQLVVILGVCGLLVWRVRQIDSARILPEPRRTPLVVKPLYNEPTVVTDEQLATVLEKLEPRLRSEQPKINHADHALRLWGVEAKFDAPESLSGEELRELLLDHRRFAKMWLGEARPLLIRDAGGVRVRTQEGAATASHVDHTLACLAEAGTPLDYVVHTADGQATLRDLLMRSLKVFALDQVEYEWSSLAYTLYLPPTTRWYTTDGQEITFDRLAERLMREPLSRGVCAGNHRLHALVMMLRVDQQQRILSDDARRRIVAHLQDATRRLVENQHRDGYWDVDWPTQPAGDERVNAQGADQLSKRILATGHALEWWALAPAETHPPRETLVRAGQWLVRTINELDDKQVGDYYTFLTHAGRALALWRGDFPAALHQRLHGSKSPPASDADEPST
ncbi:MAG: hypothetical protein RIC55_26015 [Pirellulaceae bacterium]